MEKPIMTAVEPNSVPATENVADVNASASATSNSPAAEANATADDEGEKKPDVKMIIVPEVKVVTTAGGKKVYSAVDQDGIEHAVSIPETQLERAYGAANGVLAWKKKQVLFFNPRISKWVRIETVEAAVERLTPKATSETKARETKPKAPDASMLADGKIVVAEADANAEAKADTNVTSEGEDLSNKADANVSSAADKGPKMDANEGPKTPEAPKANSGNKNHRR